MTDSSWISEELSGANFKDERLSKRLLLIADSLSKKSEQSIPAAMDGWHDTVATYRFFDNEKVTPAKILEPHLANTVKRIKSHNIVLCLQDTTELDYSSKSDIEGLGPLNTNTHRGFLLHPTIAITPEREFLGIVNANMYTRDSIGDKELDRKRPIEDKESIRWLDSFEIVDGVARECSDTLMVNIADREGDIYELFHETGGIRHGAGAHWLVRAAYNRKVSKDTKLWDTVEKEEVCGHIEFKLPKRGNTPARIVTQELRICKVKLGGSRREGGALPPLEVTAVLAREINSPKGSKPVEWLLLSSLPVYGKECALMLMQWYLCRWEIEIFFKTLKSGCTVEELQLEHISNLYNCVTLYMIIAWRVMFIRSMGLKIPDENCTLIFTDNEWQSVYCISNKTKILPEQPPSVYQMIIMIAKLGGFLGRKGDGYPGVTTIWIGFQRMVDFAHAWAYR